MKKVILFTVFVLFVLISCSEQSTNAEMTPSKYQMYGEDVYEYYSNTVTRIENIEAVCYMVTSDMKVSDASIYCIKK